MIQCCISIYITSYKNLTFFYIFRNALTFQISFESFDKTSQIISRQTGLQDYSSFITDMLGERKRGQATADYDSNTKDELSLMSYEVNSIFCYCPISGS